MCLNRSDADELSGSQKDTSMHLLRPVLSIEFLTWPSAIFFAIENIYVSFHWLLLATPSFEIPFSFHFRTFSLFLTCLCLYNKNQTQCKANKRKLTSRKSWKSWCLAQVWAISFHIYLKSVILALETVVISIYLQIYIRLSLNRCENQHQKAKSKENHFHILFFLFFFLFSFCRTIDFSQNMLSTEW